VRRREGVAARWPHAHAPDPLRALSPLSMPPRRPPAGPRPQGTDGSDFRHRQTVESSARGGGGGAGGGASFPAARVGVVRDRGRVVG